MLRWSMLWALGVACTGPDEPATDSPSVTDPSATPTALAYTYFPACEEVYDKATCACVESEGDRRLGPELGARIGEIARMTEADAKVAATELDEEQLSAIAEFLGAFPDACGIPDPS